MVSMTQYDLIVDTIRQPIGNSNAKYVLIVIASYCNAEATCFPSIARIAHDTQLSRRTVQRAIQWLVDHGFLLRQDRNQTSPIYTITEKGGSKLSNEINGGGVTVTPEDDSNKIVSLNSIRDTSLSITHNSYTSSSSGVRNAHPDDTEEFVTFWNAYPRKVAKGAARQAFKRALKKVDYHEIMTALADFRRVMAEKDKQYIPHAATWLNQERWEDEIEDISPAQKTNADRLNEILGWDDNVVALTATKKLTEWG